MADSITLVDSFPFDSSPNLVYTDQGYPRGDRAVDAWTMQNVFKQFFSDGVFGTPGDALQIGKGQGMSITVQPGMFIINGGMGGIKESDGPLTMALGIESAHGDMYFAVMLRYDNNTSMRSLGLRLTSQAGKVPEPDKTTANVMEYRLGYIMVPNGSTDVSAATVVNEKGSSACPYASPYVPLDVSGVTADARNAAQEALSQLATYIEQNKELVASALDETTVGHLQQQINDLQEGLESFDLGDKVDDETIEYSNTSSSVEKKLRVKRGGIGMDSLSDALKISLGVIDTSGYSFQDFYDAMNGIGESDQNKVAQLATSEQVNSWTAYQVAKLFSVLEPSPQGTIIGKLTAVSSWGAGELADVLGNTDSSNKSALEAKATPSVLGSDTAANIIKLFGSCTDGMQQQVITSMDLSTKNWSEIPSIKKATGAASMSRWVGKSKPVTVTGYGETNAVCVGVDVDDLTQGGKADMTFAVEVADNVVPKSVFGETGGWDGYDGVPALSGKVVPAYLPNLPADLRGAIKQVDKNTIVDVTTYSGITFSTTSSTGNTIFFFSWMEYDPTDNAYKDDFFTYQGKSYLSSNAIARDAFWPANGVRRYQHIDRNEIGDKGGGTVLLGFCI